MGDNSEIQEARKTPLADLLQERGYKLEELPGGNFRLRDFGDLTVKEHYWPVPRATSISNVRKKDYLILDFAVLKLTIPVMLAVI